ncbi:hypothetical protein ACTXT7_005961 [Hymenolepis weldensis]
MHDNSLSLRAFELDPTVREERKNSTTQLDHGLGSQQTKYVHTYSNCHIWRQSQPAGPTSPPPPLILDMG